MHEEHVLVPDLVKTIKHMNTHLYSTSERNRVKMCSVAGVVTTSFNFIEM